MSVVEESNTEPDEELDRARINSETAKIAWKDLQRFFAKGTAVFVSPGLDLVDVAWQLSADNKEQIESWLGTGGLGRVSDAQAREWFDANALMWAVVVKPWVLVQPILKRPGASESSDLD